MATKNKKLNSYQKLKLRNAELISDIYALVDVDDQSGAMVGKGVEVFLKWYTKLTLERTKMFGGAKRNTKGLKTFSGFIEQVKA